MAGRVGGKLVAELHRYFVKNPEKLDTIVKKLATLAAAGDMKAMGMIFERESGKVADTVMHSFNNSYLNTIEPPDQIANQLMALGSAPVRELITSEDDIEDVEDVSEDEPDVKVIPPEGWVPLKDRPRKTVKEKVLDISGLE
jgi:hypothetical protein